MKACKVSIILPVYNTSKYLDCCMESLLNQTLEEIEIIAVNDGSTDDSLEILKKYQSENPDRLYVYNTENFGVSHARNYGLEKACGEYIWFVDSDDYVQPDACQKLYEKAKADDNDLVLFSRYDIDSESGEKKANKTFHYNQNFKAENKAYEMVKLSPFPWNKWIRKDLMRTIRFPEGIRFEDLPVSFILFTRAKNIGVINDFLYNYRVQIGFLSKLSESTLDIIKAFEFLQNTLKADGSAQFYEKELEYLCARHFFYRFEQIFNSGSEDMRLKTRLVNELFDYIEKAFPNWKDNKYLVYNLPDRIYRLIDFYASRENLLDYIEKTQNMTDEQRKEYNATVMEEYSPSAKTETLFDAVKESKAERSLLFATKQRNSQINDCAVFVSKAKKGISSSVLAMLMHIHKSAPQTKTVLACRKKAKEKVKPLLAYYGLEDTLVIHRGGENYVEYASTAKYVFADCPLEHYFKPMEGQKYVNLLTEYSAPKEIFNRAGKDYNFSAVQRSLMISDVNVFLNEKCRSKFFKKYNVENLGINSICGIYPPADLMGAGKIEEDMGKDGKKIILIVPRYKAGDDRTPVSNFRKYMASLIQLDEEMHEDELAYVCTDEFSKKAFKNIFRHIRPMPEKYDLFDFMDYADIVVTNYHPLLLKWRDMGKKAVRYIPDDSRYIKDEYFDINDNCRICTNACELAEYIHSTGRTDIKIEKNNCQKLLEAADTDGGIENNAVPEVSVLYFIGGNLTPARIKKFRQLRRNNRIKNYYLAFDEGKNPNYREESEESLEKINYIPLRFDSNTCFDSKIISAICKKGKPPLFSNDRLDEQRKKEWRKYFGGIKFDEIILLSVGELERNLMFIGASPILEYSFNWFSAEKYHSKKAFKCKVDYICKELESAQIVTVPEEMQDIKAIKNLNIE